MALTPVEVRHIRLRRGLFGYRRAAVDKELEALLRTTLVSAEKASAEMREQARKEADLIVSEAHAEARAVLRRATADRERLAAESERIKASMRAALATLEPDERKAEAA